MGGFDSGNGFEISTGTKTLKVEAQECCRGEINPADRRSGPCGRLAESEKTL
jgi:hypothetical protein